PPLASARARRRRLIEEPDLIHSAPEELLRVFAPVTMAREVIEDTVIGGCPMRTGDRVLLPFPSGTRDPAVFDQPDRVILDREVNPHFAFGLGPPRPLGPSLSPIDLPVTSPTLPR